MSLMQSVAELPTMLHPNSVAVAPGPPFAVGAHGQVVKCARNLLNLIPDTPLPSIFVSQLHRAHLNGVQVAVKQLRAGTSDLEAAEQLLLEEAALMQVREY
jgi:hypothetical protein